MNDILNADLYFSLLKLCKHQIVLTMDFEKAYLQINIDEAQSDYLKFLWYRNLQEESIIKYKFARDFFCVTSSLFLLNGTVQTYANKYENVDPEFARKVKKHFHVDCLHNVAQSKKEGFEFHKKVKSRFSEASFNIRKWSISNPELCKLIDDYEKRCIDQTSCK